MKDADLFPTICGYHWLPVFANRPRRNKLAEQIRLQLCPVPENQTGHFQCALAWPDGDTSGAGNSLKRHE